MSTWDLDVETFTPIPFLCAKKAFQVNQQTKSGKWKCRMCGKSQSIVKVWGRGGLAKDLRGFVMELNASAGHGDDRSVVIARGKLNATMPSAEGTSSGRRHDVNDRFMCCHEQTLGGEVPQGKTGPPQRNSAAPGSLSGSHPQRFIMGRQVLESLDPLAGDETDSRTKQSNWSKNQDSAPTYGQGVSCEGLCLVGDDHSENGQHWPRYSARDELLQSKSPRSRWERYIKPKKDPGLIERNNNAQPRFVTSLQGVTVSRKRRNDDYVRGAEPELLKKSREGGASGLSTLVEIESHGAEANTRSQCDQRSIKNVKVGPLGENRLSNNEPLKVQAHANAGHDIGTGNTSRAFGVRGDDVGRVPGWAPERSLDGKNVMSSRWSKYTWYDGKMT